MVGERSLARWIGSPPGQRALHLSCNLACALFFLSVLYDYSTDPLPESPWLVIPIVLVCGAMAVMIMFRPSAEAVRADPLALAVATASKLYYLGFDLSGAPSAATGGVGFGLIGAGMVAWTVSVSYLNTSFSVLPARRSVRTAGPYRIVRHPIYASYLILDAGVVALFPTWRNLGVTLAAAGLYGIRASMEEQLLDQTPDYREYALRTRFRFLPWVY